MVCVLKDVLFKLFRLLIYQKDLKIKSLIDMVQIVLNFTDYLLQDLVKFLDLLELMVLENQLHWEYYLEIWNLIWEILKNHQSGKKY